MNKKNMLLAMSLMLLSVSSLFPVTNSEARAIRKELYAVSEGNVLSMCQFVEPGLSIEEVVDRDLRIIIEHRDVLQKKIDVSKGFVVRSLIPFLNKMSAIASGTIFATTGSFAILGSDWVSNVWNGQNDTRVWFADHLVNVGSWLGALTPQDKTQYMAEKVNYLNQQNPGFMNIAAIAPIAGAVSVVSGILFFKSFYDVCRYKSTIDAYVKKVKIRLGRDQKVIAQLKEIKYSLQG